MTVLEKTETTLCELKKMLAKKLTSWWSERSPAALLVVRVKLYFR